MHAYLSGVGAGRAIGRTVVAIAAAAALAACSTDKLTEVDTPDQITPEQANSPTGAAALRTAALGNFANYFAGDNAGNGVGMNIATGLLGDEMISARGGTEHLDSRAVNEAVFPATVWTTFGQANTQIIRAIAALKEFAPEGATKVSQIAQLYMLQGFTYVIAAEAYCNGIPVGSADDKNPQQKTEILTNNQLFDKAIAYFDTALTTAATTDTKIRSAALVGKARALVDLKRYSDGAALLAPVTTDYVYNVEYSATTIVNDVYDWMFATPNFGPADKEGGNGLDYVSSKDPRIKVDATKTRPGQDGTPIWVQQMFTKGDAPVPLATGIEARLIEAEALLAANDVTGWLGKLNAARATLAGLAPLTDPGSTAARVDLLFRERAFWMYFTSHRVGDMRRLIRQYGRAANTVFPSGNYFKGGVYGSDVNLPPSQAERNNPDYPGCANRDA